MVCGINVKADQYVYTMKNKKTTEKRADMHAVSYIRNMLRSIRDF